MLKAEVVVTIGLAVIGMVRTHDELALDHSYW
jgi:hypothetical protein